MRIEIEKLVYGGDGLARVEGEVVFTPFVLPGELVDVQRRPQRSGTARASLERIVSPSAERVAAPCPYFGRCGGCHYQHAAYGAQVASKQAILAETLARVGKIERQPEIRTITGEPWQYRNRVQLHFADRNVGYREMRSDRLVAIDHCPISSPKLNEAIAVFSRLARDRRWPSFLETMELFTDESLVQLNVIATAKPLARRFFDWLAEEIPGATSGPIDYGKFRVSYRSFFQVNRFLIEPLVRAVTGDDTPGSLALDLYAGVGLFTVALAPNFAEVVAVESNASAARDLELNVERFGATAAVEARNESVDAFLATLQRRPNHVVADPPRSGLGPYVTRRLVEIAPSSVVVVACDPATLARDAALLIAGGYELSDLTLIDLFPQTFHIETMARFRSR